MLLVAPVIGGGGTGCGGSDEPSRSGQPGERAGVSRNPLYEPGDSGTLHRTACGLLRPREVAVAVRRPRLRLQPAANNSLDLSVCDWRAGGLRVQMLVDSAPRAQLRYYNQLSEQLQFFNADPRRRPYQLKGVGQDSAYGGAGAWWTKSKGQLVAYSRTRIVRIRIVEDGLSDARRRRSAARLGRLAFRRLSAPGG